MIDTTTYALLASVLAVLGITTAVAVYLPRLPSASWDPTLLDRFRDKLRVWWTMVVLFVMGLLIHRLAIILLFALVSFWCCENSCR